MWIDRRGLSKETFRSQRTINFIGAHLHIFLPALPSLLPGVIPGFLRPLEEVDRAHDIGGHEDLWVGDTAVHMRLSCEVDDVVGVVVRDELRHQLFITDISVNKDMPFIVLQILQIFQVTGIGQRIKVDNLDVRVLLQHVVNEG